WTPCICRWASPSGATTCCCNCASRVSKLQDELQQVRQVLRVQAGFESFGHERLAQTLEGRDVRAQHGCFHAAGLAQRQARRRLAAQDSGEGLTVLRFDEITDVI